MNNEQIIDEVYNNYLAYIHDVVQGENQIYGDWYGKEEFINKCKTDREFSDEWGLKIEERELSLEERYTIARQYALCPKYSNIGLENCTEEEHYTKYKVPTKQTTITYKEQTIESYD